MDKNVRNGLVHIVICIALISIIQIYSMKYEMHFWYTVTMSAILAVIMFRHLYKIFTLPSNDTKTKEKNNE